MGDKIKTWEDGTLCGYLNRICVEQLLSSLWEITFLGLCSEEIYIPKALELSPIFTPLLLCFCFA